MVCARVGAGRLFAAFILHAICLSALRENFDDEAYEVTSVDNDVVLLNMIVCSRCALVARELKLPTQKIDPPSRP